MGTDIHTILEVKIDDTWHYYSRPSIQRDYNLFARMADIRNTGHVIPISIPRGIKLDVSKISNIEIGLWADDGHSISWLSEEEFGEVIEHCDKYHSTSTDNLGYIFGYDLLTYYDTPNDKLDLPEGFQEIRLLFWFDN